MPNMHRGELLDSLVSLRSHVEDVGDVSVGFLAPADLEYMSGAGGESEMGRGGRRREGATRPIRAK